jgi:hypothetical protein
VLQVHVLPLRDMREHVEHPLCWCGPWVECVGRGLLVTHNSMDGRELVERHGVQ